MIKPGVKEAFESLKPEDKLSEKVATPHEDGLVFIPDAETLAQIIGTSIPVVVSLKPFVATCHPE